MASTATGISAPSPSRCLKSRTGWRWRAIGALWQWGVMNRSVSLTLTADDYVAANQLHFLNGLRSRNALAVLAVMAVAYLVWTAIAYFDQWEALRVVALNVFFAVVVILTIANYFLLVPMATRRTYRNHKA